MPLVHIAACVDPTTGKAKAARGVLAFGGKATGIFAFGGRARGVIACGGVAEGVLAVGGISFGVFGYGGLVMALLVGTGGIAVAPIALGGLAVGLLAFGGLGLSAFLVAGPDAGPIARWLVQNYFETKLPVVLAIVANLCWVIPTIAMVIFRRRHERAELDAERGSNSK